MVEPSASFESLLNRGALVLLAVAGLWGAAVLAAVLLEGLSDGRFRMASRLGCPPTVHRWLLVTVTATFAASLQVPPVGAEERRAPTAPTALVLDGLLLPDRPSGDRVPAPDRRAREPPGAPATVRVRPGDSLWAISRRLLPADASAAAIASLTSTLYAHNRSTVGADPDLILPGQRLLVPPAVHETYSEDS
jgi:hypothetical protein